jgi:LysM repeat protein
LQLSVKTTIIVLQISSQVYAETSKNSQAYRTYIEKYADLAVMHQREYRIPASITLSQAIMESGGGESNLARKSNNHFGIKCHGWKGRSVAHDDDLPGECFRTYKTVEESYDDHSRFLSERPYYRDLFKLKVDDYTGWAKGLQKSGYSTDKSYADKLIKIIENYELYKYDKEKKSNYTLNAEKQQVEWVVPTGKPFSLDKVDRKVLENGGLSYVHALDNDSFEQIADILKIDAGTLRAYNEMLEGLPLQKGDIVYIEKKKKKADKPNYDHIVQAGESMYSISQLYGMQIKSLYKINKKKPDYVPTGGDVLKLR